MHINHTLGQVACPGGAGQGKQTLHSWGFLYHFGVFVSLVFYYYYYYHYCHCCLVCFSVLIHGFEGGLFVVFLFRRIF